MFIFFKRYWRRFILQQMKIGTHDGRFHCDQVLACTMLTKYTKQFKNASIIRSRDPKVLEQCDIVVDVGGKYEPPRLLDHHQIQFQDTYPGYNIRLSSAGLVYLHFEEIIPNIVNEIIEKQKANLTFDPKVDEEILKMIREKIYKNFIIFIDANDNGVNKIDEKEVVGVPTTLWSRVAKINPMWCQTNVSELERFQKAMEMANEEIYSEVKSILLGSVQTKSVVKEAFVKRKQCSPSGKVILLQKYVPWVKPLFDLEQEEKCVGQILYCIFPDKSGKWRIQAVPEKQGSFNLRKGIKQEWRGIKDQEKLVKLSGIQDIDFVHANGFIGGAVSKESALKMAELSL